MKYHPINFLSHVIAIFFFFSSYSLAQQTNIVGPIGSERFGTKVIALPNGNIVVTDPAYDIPSGTTNVGAVYLYNGSTGVLISTLTGSSTGDAVGNGGITVLANGNYVISSLNWNGVADDVGAVTFANANTGVSGVVSAANSLVGATENDFIGKAGIIALTNGNYVVISDIWTGTQSAVGAVTFGNGTTGISGVISSSNSLVGSRQSDFVGRGGVTSLANGNYVVSSPHVTINGRENAGAITFGDGTNGTTGFVTTSNSVIGSTAFDMIGNGGVTALSNSNFVISSPDWDNGATNDVGAATFGSGTIGVTGTISSSNSLLGQTANDQISSAGIIALTNGNYVVISPKWDGSSTANIGAVTFGNGTSGISGAVSASNSLVGSTGNDFVGDKGVIALTNGNYVVISPNWRNAGVGVGAVTFGNGTSGITGTVSMSNSLIGSTLGDTVGFGGVTALTNGNYVVSSPFWDGTATDIGAVTLGNGVNGTIGTVTNSNSLVGSTAFDNVGFGGVTALTNGNYVVISHNWDGAAQDVGATTLGNGLSGITGTVSASNSLIGSTAFDYIGGGGVTALTNGNYVVSSPSWDSSLLNVGAATFGNGTSGITGMVSASNSLIGATQSDSVSIGGISALTGGEYIVYSPNFNNGSSNNGAVTYLSGLTGNFAPLNKETKMSKQNDSINQILASDDLALSITNSVFGTATNGGHLMNFSYDLANDQLVVARPLDNIVTLFKRLAPTAANVTISGRVENTNGRGISRAVISITDSNGQVRTTRTNMFGYFRFDEIEAGDSYVINVRAKGYTFESQTINVDDNISKLIITAQ